MNFSKENELITNCTMVGVSNQEFHVCFFIVGDLPPTLNSYFINKNENIFYMLIYKITGRIILK